MTSPRRMAALFLALLLAPSLLLVGLGWRLFEQDRTAALREVKDRRSQAADMAVSMLEQAVSTTERDLLDPVRRRRIADHGDAVAIVVENGGMEADGDGVAFFPAPSPGKPVIFESTSVGTKPVTEAKPEPAVGLMREIWAAAPARKLALFNQLATIGDASIEDVPVELFARVARCDVLWGLGDSARLQKEAAEVHNDLLQGRWSISRVVYESNLSTMAKYSDHPPRSSPTRAEFLAAVIERWWRSPDSGTPADRQYLVPDDITLVWTSSGKQRVLLVAQSGFVQREWLATLSALAAAQRVRVAIRESQFRDAGPDENLKEARATGLPWTIVASDSDAAGDLARLEGRRRLWLGGLAALIVLLGAGGYFLTRVISRELAVAQLQSDFVAAVSHEFRTPLTSLRQLTEVLDDARVTSEERRQAYYRALVRQTDRLHRLVESLLDLGRLESGRSPYRLEPLDACALVRSVVERFEQETSGQGVRIDLEIDGDAWQVAGDREALTNALWNLLDNAVKYSPGSRRVHVAVVRQAERLLIRVRDEGIGIPQDEQRAIFDKFVRGTQAIADGFKGTGIGLSMVRHIVSAHGGEVMLQSAPGTGSTFTVSLPLNGT